jgi:hypothetical protein
MLFRIPPVQAISQDQHLIAPVLEGPDGGLDAHDPWGLPSELVELMLSLPRNLHWDKDQKRQEQLAQTGGAVGTASHLSAELDVLAEGDDEDDEDQGDADEGLVVAWQYKMSVQRERLATNVATPSMPSGRSSNSAVFCHSYDLSGRMADQTTIEPSNHVVTLPSSAVRSGAVKPVPANGMQLFCDLVKLLKDKAETSQEQGKAVRLLLYHPGVEILAVALPLLLAYIRKESLPVVVMICVRAPVEATSWIRLARASDAVLRTEGFASRRQYPPPPEFRHLQGILKVDKTTRKKTEIAALVYGFRRDRRKLHVPLLHIPPEDHAEGGGSVGAGGVRSGAGRPGPATDLQGTAGTAIPRKTTSGLGCSSNVAGSAFDF